MDMDNTFEYSSITTMDMDDTFEYSCSEADLIQISELVMPYLMPSLSVRELIQINYALWPSWGPFIEKRIIEVRQENNDKDWYFPIFFEDKLVTTLLTNSATQSRWFGIHHLSGSEVHLCPRQLPPLAGLPPTWITSHHIHVITGSGGLLLVRLKPCSCTPASKPPSKWQSLMVINPLTKEWKELPEAFNGCRVWNYNGVQALMVVDDVRNSYKILLTSPNFVCVYKSTSNDWEFHSFLQYGPWADHNLWPNCAWGYLCASAYVDGHLYFAVIRREPNAFMAVRLYKIDEDAGTWMFQKDFSLRYQDFLRNSSIFHVDAHMQLDWRLEMVECLGDMYAVIPVMFLSAEPGATETAEGFEVLPLQFHIHLLQDDGLSHGILVIQVPQTADDIPSRRDRIMTISSRSFDNNRTCFRNWFQCTARGSVIWVHFEDYLLQYDVVTCQSRTQLIPTDLQFEELVGFAYRPSFHMKP